MAWGTSPKWPILCRLGHKTLTESIWFRVQYINWSYFYLLTYKFCKTMSEIVCFIVRKSRCCTAAEWGWLKCVVLWIICCCLCFSFWRFASPFSVDILSSKLTRLPCDLVGRHCFAVLSSNWTLTTSAFHRVTGSTPCGTIHTRHYWSDWTHWIRQNSGLCQTEPGLGDSPLFSYFSYYRRKPFGVSCAG